MEKEQNRMDSRGFRFRSVEAVVPIIERGNSHKEWVYVGVDNEFHLGYLIFRLMRGTLNWRCSVGVMILRRGKNSIRAPPNYISCVQTILIACVYSRCAA